MDINELFEKIKDLNATVWAAIVAASAALVVGILNYVNQRKVLKIQRETLDIQKNTYNLQSNKQQNDLVNQQNEDINRKINGLQRQLEEFYRPFNSYLSQSYTFYSILRANLPKEFRTLIYLVDNNYLFKDKDGVPTLVTLNDSQLELLNQIFKVEDSLRNLITEKMTLISDEELLMIYSPDNSVTDILSSFDPNKPDDLPKNLGLLDLFLVHCTMIKLASSKILDKAKINEYARFVYPRELNKKIQANITDLEIQIKTLKAQIKAI